MDPLSIAASTITVIQSLLSTYETIKHIKDLPKAFAEVGQSLPLVKETLDLAHQALDADKPDDNVKSAIQPALIECLKRADTIRDIFSEIEPGNEQEKDAKEWSAIVRFYRKKVIPFGKAHKVEALMQDILNRLKVLAIHRVFKLYAESRGQIEKLEKAIKLLAEVEPSLPDSEFDGASATNVVQHISDSGRGLVSTGSYSEIAMGNTNKYQSGGGAMHFAYHVHDSVRIECDPNSSPIEWLKHTSKPLDFEKIQDESFQISQRTPKAGQWFLESAVFQEEWRDGTLRKLWCHGIPGTGKTVLSSIVVNHLRSRFSSNEKIACIHVYFDHRQQQDHSLAKLLCNVILQLIRGPEHVTAKIQEAHSCWKTNRQMPCERHYFKMLKSQAKAFERIFFVIDALDECLDDVETNTLNTFLEACRELPVNFHQLFTSRPAPKLGNLIKPGFELPITANDDEVKAYLNRFIDTRPQLNGVVDKGCKADPSFRNKALETIVEKSHGMQVLMLFNQVTQRLLLTLVLQRRFLLAHLHIQSLASTHTLAGFKSNLAHLSTSPDAVYTAALERIKKQEKAQRDLAITALNWLVYAERQLTVDELAHAIAIHNVADDMQSGRRLLPKASEILGIEDALISACVGIVVVLSAGHNKKIVRLTHSTAEEYMKNNQAALFMNRESMMTSMLSKTCLYCLAGILPSTQGSSEPNLVDICEDYPLFAYAANYWGIHLDKSTGSKGDLYKLAWSFVSDKWKLTNAVRAMTDPRVSHERNVSGVHISAFFGLDKLVKKAIAKNKTINLNAQTRREETPLHWAATYGRRSFAELLVQGGVDLNIPNVDKRTALHKAIMVGNREVLNLLLSCGSPNLELEDSEGYTCLRWASKYGQLKTVEALLKAGAEADASDKDGYTALRWAAHEGYKPIIKSLVRHGASVETSGRDSWTLLKWAAQEGQEDMIKFLIKRRVDLDSTDADGFTALRWAVNYNRAMTVWMLIQARADVHKPDNQGTQPLHAVVRSCTAPKVSKACMDLFWLLLNSNTNINAQAGHHDQTPLHIAAAGGSSSAVWLLLENGADPRIRDSSNRTALHCAVSGKNVEVCSILIRKDGDYLVHAVDRHGRTPLHAAAVAGSNTLLWLLKDNGADPRQVDSNRRTVLHCAIQGEHVDICRALILEAAEDLVHAVDDEKRSPLHHAASWGNLSIVELLLHHEASVDAQDSKGLTPLHLAVSQGHTRVVDLLLRRGADPHLAITRRGRTALHLAANFGHVEIIETLLDHGLVINVQDGRGDTPLHVAVSQGHGKVASFLVKRGADPQAQNRRGLRPADLRVVSKEVRAVEQAHSVVGAERAENSGPPTRTEEKNWWKGDRRFAARVEDE